MCEYQERALVEQISLDVRFDGLATCHGATTR